jgi:hypothetical protein
MHMGITYNFTINNDGNGVSSQFFEENSKLLPKSNTEFIFRFRYF